MHQKLFGNSQTPWLDLGCAPLGQGRDTLGREGRERGERNKVAYWLFFFHFQP